MIPPPIRFHNTESGRLVPLAPLAPPKIGLYTCGPTVHDFAHVGNFRTFTWEDLLRRFLEFTGHEVLHVMNITDVDDKTIRKSIAAGLSLDQYTSRYTEAFFDDLRTLRFRPAHHYPRATHHVPEMIEIIRRLIEKGVAYERAGSIYFRIASFPAYGRLSGVSRRELLHGVSVDSDEYEKEDVRDFVLWKAPKEPGEPSWDAPFGRGRPGWHIECSAMSMKYLGESFDIHTGGVDNIFPHHENEIAQSEAATGRPFVRIWMHAAHLQIDGEKMAKSLGNFHTLRDLLDQGWKPRVLRHALLGTHYRKSLSFSHDGLRQAEAELSRVDDLRYRLVHESVQPGENQELSLATREARSRFIEALSEDLNVSEAMGALFVLIRETNSAYDRRQVGEANRQAIGTMIHELDGILGVLEWEEELAEAEVEQLIQARQEARKARDFGLADKLRAELTGRGILLEDTPHGVRWKRRGPA